MDILYISNKKIRKSYIIEAIFNIRCTINNIDPYVGYISIYSKKINGLKNDLFLLLDNIRKVIAFK